MEEKKMTVFDMYMFAWSVLSDIQAVGYSRMSEEEQKAIEITMNFLAKRYMVRAMSALHCGIKKDDSVQEFTNEVVRQRIMEFNEYLKREKE
jgi:hypothetical protein